MQIGGATHTIMATHANKTGNELPPAKTQEAQQPQDKSPIRELATSIDPKNMSWRESLDLANALMKAGEGELSTAFLPLPPLKLNDDGSMTDLRGTPEGDAIMSAKFNMFDSLKDRIEYKTQNNQPTKILDDALVFLEKLQIAKTTPSINFYT